MNDSPHERRNSILWLGIVIGLLSAATILLNVTAVPVVLDVPLAGLVLSTAATATLLVGLSRERHRGMAAARLRRWLGVACLPIALGVAAWSTHDRFMTYRADEVRFRNGDVSLAGTVFSPRASGKYPGVVLVHGSGPETRKEPSFYARHFARHNFTALAYDKRGAGQSTGELYESDYNDYAGDALAAVQSLQQTPGVDSKCIGLIGFSEGEWVGPLAASHSSDIAFVIVVAPSGVSPSAQVNEEIAIRMRARGAAPAHIDRALALNRQVFDYERTGRAPAGLAEALSAASTTQ